MTALPELLGVVVAHAMLERGTIVLFDGVVFMHPDTIAGLRDLAQYADALIEVRLRNLERDRWLDDGGALL